MGARPGYLGHATVFRAEDGGRMEDVRILPVGVVEETAKIHVIHDITFKVRTGQRRY